MADTAAHRVDRVLPGLRVAQWVLSLPFALRYRLALDAPPLVFDALVRSVFASPAGPAGTRSTGGGLPLRHSSGPESPLIG
jgi:hypothetical protein